MRDEYSFLEQLYVTGFNGYVILVLLLLSLSACLLSWGNCFHLKNKRLTRILLFALPLLLLLAILNVYHFAWKSEQTAIWWTKGNNFEDVPSKLFLAGYYVAKLIPFYTLLLAAIIFISYLPLLVTWHRLTEEDKH